MHFREEESESRTWNKTKGMMLKLVLVVGVLMIVGATIFPRERVVPAVRSFFANKNPEALSDIRGGDKANAADFPEVVGISFYRKTGPGTAALDRCTGVRVGIDDETNKEKVVTAGHCCGPKTFSHLVWLGVQIQATEDEPTAQFFAVSARYTIKDPAYSWPEPTKDNTPVNDLCVILVKGQVPGMPDKTDYPTVSTTDPGEGTEVWIAGFGRKKYKDNKEMKLHKAKVKVDKTEDCTAARKDMSNKADVAGKVICASLGNRGTTKTDQNACSGDSGGPLFNDKRDGSGKYKLYGILSDGPRPCEKGPAWYTKMSVEVYKNFVDDPDANGVRTGGEPSRSC